QEMGGDQRRLLRPDDAHVRLGQHVVDRAREIKADDEGGEKGVESSNEPGAQLNQVVHQRRLRGVDVLLGHSAALGLASGASIGAGVSCGAGSGVGAFASSRIIAPTSKEASVFALSL